MYRQTTLAFLTWVLSVPLLAAQQNVAKLPSPSADAEAFCSRVGEVLGREVFAQTFLLKHDDGQTETVPFSRWTEFFRISPDSRSGKPREIEPTDIRLGDRLCVLLDLSEASARLILVLERARALVKDSRSPTLWWRYDGYVPRETVLWDHCPSPPRRDIPRNKLCTERLLDGGDEPVLGRTSSHIARDISLGGRLVKT